MKTITTKLQKIKFNKKLARFYESCEKLKSSYNKTMIIKNTIINGTSIKFFGNNKSKLIFSNCVLINVNFYHDTLDGTIFKDCRFKRCTFYNCRMKGVSFIGDTYIYDTAFEDCLLQRSVLSYIDLKLCRFLNCNLTGSIFVYSIITSSSFKKCSLENAQFFGASFIGDINTEGSRINDSTSGLAPIYGFYPPVKVDDSVNRRNEYYGFMAYYDKDKNKIIIFNTLCYDVINTTRNYYKGGKIYVEGIYEAFNRGEAGAIGYESYTINDTDFCGEKICINLCEDIELKNFSGAEIGVGFRMYENDEIALLSIPYEIRKKVMESNNPNNTEENINTDNDIEVLSVDDIETPDDLDLDKVLEEDNN